VLYSVSYARLSGFVIEGANGPSSASVYFQADTHHVELSGNDIRNNLTQGIFSDPTTHDLQILGNKIHDNGPNAFFPQTHGIYLEGSNQLVANVIYDNRYGFGVQGLSECE
jgi:Right handed beta helix region